MGVSRGWWALAALVAAVPAGAQTDRDKPAPKPDDPKPAKKKLFIGPQLGVYLPSNALSRDRFGATWTNIGFGMGPISSPTEQGEANFDITFISSRNRLKGSGTQTFGENILIVPIGVLYRRGIGSDETPGGHGYWGGSLGAVVTNIESQFDNIKSGWRSGYGGSVFAGVVLSQQAYAEARYFQASKIKGFDLSGLNLSVGYRF